MLKTSPLLIVLLLIVSPAVAQELEVEPFPPTEGILLIHSGTFTAAASDAESVGCTGYDDNERQQVSEVRFNPPFLGTPQVIVSLNLLDFGVYEEAPRNVRISARAETVVPEAMTLIVKTWCDTIMHGASGTYLAIGQPFPLEQPSELIDEETLESAPVSSGEQEPLAAPEQQPSDLPLEW